MQFNKELREQIQAFPAAPVSEGFDVPGWGMAIHARRLSAGDALAIRAAPEDQRTWLMIARGACDAAGARIFTDADCDWLSEQEAAIVEVLASQIAGYNALGTDPKA